MRRENYQEGKALASYESGGLPTEARKLVDAKK